MSFTRFGGSVTFKAPLARVTRQMVDNTGYQLILDPRPRGWFRYPEPEDRYRNESVRDMLMLDTKRGLYEGRWRHFLGDFVVIAHSLKGIMHKIAGRNTVLFSTP